MHVYNREAKGENIKIHDLRLLFNVLCVHAWLHDEATISKLYCIRLHTLHDSKCLQCS